MVVLKALVACFGLILGGFHVWLLGQQAWTGQLHSTTSVRWLLAFCLVGALVALHRQGASLWGRRATAVWVLATVLHGPSLGSERVRDAQLVETSGIAIQIAGAALGVALAVALGRGARGWQPALAYAAAATRPIPSRGPRHLAYGEGVLPRPPPRG